MSGGCGRRRSSSGAAGTEPKDGEGDTGARSAYQASHNAKSRGSGVIMEPTKTILKSAYLRSRWESRCDSVTERRPRKRNCNGQS